MNRMRRPLSSTIVQGAAITGLLMIGSVTAGCEDKPAANIAPTSSALTAAKPPAMGAIKFAVDKESSKVEFLMDAPKEKIRGKVYKSTEGELQIDMDDITKSTGLITIDISGIELFQAMPDETGKFGGESKSEGQNKHARTWLEISDDTPEETRKQNAKVQFSIKSIVTKGDKSVLAMPGTDRTLDITATGDFLLHGHKAPKTADLLVTFHFEGTRPVSAVIKTSKPISVDLAEFDVKPRDAFGKLATKTLDVLSPKVNKEAPVTFELTAKVIGSGAAAPAKSP